MHPALIGYFFASLFEQRDNVDSRPTVYVLTCSDGSLYTGATTNLARRVAAHRCGRGAKYTRGRLPIALIAWWHPQTFAAARSHEARFKRLSRSRKLAALRGGVVYGCRVYAPRDAMHTISPPRRMSRA